MTYFNRYGRITKSFYTFFNFTTQYWTVFTFLEVHLQRVEGQPPEEEQRLAQVELLPMELVEEEPPSRAAFLVVASSRAAFPVVASSSRAALVVAPSSRAALVVAPSSRAARVVASSSSAALVVASSSRAALVVASSCLAPLVVESLVVEVP